VSHAAATIVGKERSATIRKPMRKNVIDTKEMASHVVKSRPNLARDLFIAWFIANGSPRFMMALLKTGVVI
jgi:hypothetical protein